jgi:hypothetical protein
VNRDQGEQDHETFLSSSHRSSILEHDPGGSAAGIGRSRIAGSLRGKKERTIDRPAAIDVAGATRAEERDARRRGRVARAQGIPLGAPSPPRMFRKVGLGGVRMSAGSSG